MIRFEIVLELVVNGLDFVWKLVGNLSKTSLDKSSWNYWVILKRTDRFQLLCPGLLDDICQILSPA